MPDELLTTNDKGQTIADRRPGPLSFDRYRLLLAAFTLLYLLLIWIVRFLPFVDLPQHLSLVSILRGYSNPATDYRRMFDLKLYPTHNVLHLLFCYVFSFVFGIETANRIFLSLYVVMFPLAMEHLLKTVGGNRWLTFAGFLFVYNFDLLWGFVSSAFVIPLIIYLISLEIRQLSLDRPRVLPLIGISLLFVVIFLGHSLFYLFATVLFLVVLIARLVRARGVSKYVVPMLLTLLPALLFFVIPWQLNLFAGEGGDLVSRVLGGFTISSLVERMADFYSSVYTRGDDVSLFVLKLYSVVGLTAVAVHAARYRVKVLFSGRFRPVTLLVITALAAFFFFPSAISQAWFLNERFGVFIYLFLTALLALIVAVEEYRPRWALVVLLTVVAFNAVNLGYRFVAFDREARPVADLLPGLEKGRKLVGLIYETKPKPDLLGYDVFLHFANYYQVWNGGYPGFSFASIRYSPIQYHDSTDFLPPGYEWSPEEYILPDGWDVYDYFLVHGRVPPQDQPFIDKLLPVASEGEWTVYRAPDSMSAP